MEESVERFCCSNFPRWWLGGEEPEGKKKKARLSGLKTVIVERVGGKRELEGGLRGREEY